MLSIAKLIAFYRVLRVKGQLPGGHTKLLHGRVRNDLGIDLLPTLLRNRKLNVILMPKNLTTLSKEKMSDKEAVEHVSSFVANVGRHWRQHKGFRYCQRR